MGGDWQGGAIRYFHGAFTAYTVKDGLPNNHVVRIDEDNAGTIWIFTEPGLSTWKNGKITKLAPAPNSPFNPYLNPPLNLGIDSYLYGLWRLCSFGWQRFAYGQWSDVPIPPDAASLRAVKLDQLVEDSQRRIWFKIIGRNQEIFGVDQGHLTIYKGVPKGSFACYQDRSGRLWITDPGGHAGWWKDGQFTPISGFSTPSLFRVFEDRDHEYWVGTLNEGLFRLARQEVSILRLPGGPVRNRIGPCWSVRLATSGLAVGVSPESGTEFFVPLFESTGPRGGSMHKSPPACLGSRQLAMVKLSRPVVPFSERKF